MSTDPTDPTQPGQPGQPSEEEMRAAYEQEIKRLRVEDVLVQTLVSLINLGGRKAGLAEGTEDERDPQQLQMAFAHMAGGAGGQPGAQPGGAPSDPAGEQPQGPGQPPSSGRLWVPGQ